jgi:LmbE family N-acetylglucosaminyl deacetylase
MSTSSPPVDFYIPDDTDRAAALYRTTHLGIGAHQDDLEFMAFHGIAACSESSANWFGGITCTHGGGSSRTGSFKDYTDQQIMEARMNEQRKAADIGNYSFVAQLGHASSELTGPSQAAVIDELEALLRETRPKVVYTHNPADKHPTHVKVFVCVIAALRRLAPEERPEQVLGCELWRGLDWLLEEDKVVLDVSGQPALQQELAAVFASQIKGGKRYDRAIPGRQYANATLLDPHQPDAADQVAYAMNLTPLIQADAPDIIDFVQSGLTRMAQSVTDILRSHLPQ